jgi:hypothetical protein
MLVFRQQALQCATGLSGEPTILDRPRGEFAE